MADLLIRCGADVGAALLDLGHTLTPPLRPMLVQRTGYRNAMMQRAASALSLLHYGRIFVAANKAPMFGRLTHWLAIDLLRAFDSNAVLTDQQLQFLVETLQSRTFFATRVEFVTALLIADEMQYEIRDRWIATCVARALSRYCRLTTAQSHGKQHRGAVADAATTPRATLH